ncbi:hypothetical protein SD37_38540 [Amycolatopsis orientalis]|uniref:DUF3558 domain-containing protein n=1 Tax=Amycolatopsis orientalis TaxID=31958 RepID=A0A193C8Z1_AMYOR|nr:DUF3558 domain-containing protein [Amycolatopsis orientalis]ANN20909.1 hypothetical protein SD37_38540 [Amycolatopsis orientalis]
MRRTILLASVIALVLSACSPSTENGTPAPTTGDARPIPSSTTGQLPGPGVPKVDDPINLVQIKTTPCKALTSAQVKELLGSEGETRERLDGSSGPSCLWAPHSATRPTVSVLFSKAPDRGMTSVYEAKGTTYKLFEPLGSIDGYPVTAYGTEDERASRGKCSVALGTSDNETIDIVLEQSEANIGKKDPCDAAREAAIRVLATVRGGGN